MVRRMPKLSSLFCFLKFDSKFKYKDLSDLLMEGKCAISK